MEQTFLKKIYKTSKAEVSNHKKIKLILLIFTIMGTVLALSVYTSRDHSVHGKSYTITEFDGAFGIVLIFAAAFFGMFAVFGIFKDMVNKQTSDVQMSLPMSAKERYLSKLAALFRIHILPILCSEVIMIVVGGLIASYSGTMMLIRLYTVILAQALFVDSVSILCMCCCGALAEGVYTSLISMFCLSATPYCTFELTMVRFSGLLSSDVATEKGFSLLGVLSMEWIPSFGFSDVIGYNDEGWYYLFGNILISCLMIFAAFFIYKNRDARKVGKPFAYDLFMEIFMFIGLFTLYLMFYSSRITGIGVAATFIVYFVIRIVASRAKINAKVFLIWVLKFAASMAAFYLIVMISYFTGGFGFYKYFPDTSNIESASIRISTEDDSYNYHYFREETFTKGDTKYYTDKCHDLVKKYNSIDDRNLEDFLQGNRIDDYYSMRYSYSRNKNNRIEISIHNNQPSLIEEDGIISSEEVYDMRIYLSDEEYEKALAEIQQSFSEENINVR